MLYSIIIPVYNEAKRIPKNIGEIFAFFGSLEHEGVATEIIFVSDGSTDETVKVLKDYQAQYPLQLIEYKENRGKGYAIGRGVAAANGDYVVFFDIDLATPLHEFVALKNSLAAADQVVIGSRRLAQSKIEKGESGLRTFLGQGFTRLSNLLVPDIKDFTCGFKCFAGAAAKDVFSRARIERWGFDTEILYIAHLRGYGIRQIPVSWRHDDDSKVKVWRAVFSSAGELLRMKYYQLRGYYK